MKTYYINIHEKNRNTAGSKAPADIAEICHRQGYEELLMPVFPRDKSGIYQKAWLFISGTFNWTRILNTIEKDSIIIFQHPMYGNRLVDRMIPKIQKGKKAKFIAIIHDLESLRGGIRGVSSISKKTTEIADTVLLKKFDAIICHNEHMRQYLIEQGFDSEKIVNLEIFDYLTDFTRIEQKKCSKPSIAIAGNLAIGKCAYIYHIFDGDNNSGLAVNLFGNNYQEDKATSNMIYHGSFKPEELPAKLEGDFGLVWDGNSAETCAGNTGEYLKYNNPHKTSLYLASGMPVIVWSQAAIADFILANGVGVAIDSLYELEEKIRNISDEDYQKMSSNVSRVAEKLRAGYYTKKALEKAISAL